MDASSRAEAAEHNEAGQADLSEAEQKKRTAEKTFSIFFNMEALRQIEEDNRSPWIHERYLPHSYGFRVNINNPYVRELRDRWQRKYELEEVGWGLSDESRLRFELDVIPHLEKRFGSKAPPPCLPQSMREKIPMKLLLRIYGAESMRDLLEQIQQISTKK